MLKRGMLLSLMPLLVVAAACGGNSDEEVSQAYFESVEAAKSDHDAGLPLELFTAGSPEQVVEWLDQENVALKAFIERLDGLEVPESAAASHRLAVELTQERVAMQERIAAGYVGDGSLSEVRAFQRESANQRENLREVWYGAVCDLQGQARTAGITIQLGCDAEQGLVMGAAGRSSLTLPTGDAACTSVSEPRAAEVGEGQVTIAQWLNFRDESVRLYRFERAGECELMATLAPKGNTVQVTLLGVGWLVTDEADNCIGGFFPGALPGVNLQIFPG